MVDIAKTQRIHHGDRPGTHRDDVSHDSADTRRGSLKRFNVRGVIVAFDLERDGPALANIDDTGVFAHANHEVLRHLRRNLLSELPQVHFRRLVRAVFGPHNRVHGKFARRGTAAKNLANLRVLVGLEPERIVRLFFLRGRGGVLDGVGNVFGHGVSCLRKNAGGEYRLKHRQAVGARLHRGGSVGPKASFDRVLGVRHEPDDVASGVSNSGNVVERPVRIDVDVSKHDQSVALELRECFVIGDEPALTVLQGDGDFLTDRVTARPRGVGVVDAELLVSPNEGSVVVANQTTGEKVRLNEDLKSVADAENGHSLVRGVDHVGHDWRMRGNRTAPQVVAVGKSPGENDGVNALEVVFAVPEGHRLATAQPDCSQCVSIVERTRKSDDTYAHRLIRNTNGDDVFNNLIGEDVVCHDADVVEQFGSDFAVDGQFEAFSDADIGDSPVTNSL